MDEKKLAEMIRSMVAEALKTSVQEVVTASMSEVSATFDKKLKDFMAAQDNVNTKARMLEGVKLSDAEKSAFDALYVVNPEQAGVFLSEIKGGKSITPQGEGGNAEQPAPGGFTEKTTVKMSEIEEMAKKQGKHPVALIGELERDPNVTIVD